jgi:hypothetical protein
LEISIAAAMVLVVLARFYTRTFVKAVIGLDDWTMGIAMSFAVCITVIHCYGTQFGAGKHLWDVDYEKARISAKFALFTHALFPACTSITKISICITYLRILPFKVDRMFCYGTIVYLLCYFIAATIMAVLNCRPINAFWDPSVQGECIPIRIVLLVPAAFNSLTDIVVYLWPARTLWKVRQPTLQRFGLVFVFVVGCVVCVAGICRIWYLVYFLQSHDIFYDAAIVYIITCIELNVGIICGSLPALKPLLARLLPSIFGSTEGIARSFQGSSPWSHGTVRLHSGVADPQHKRGKEEPSPLSDVYLGCIPVPEPIANGTSISTTQT